MKYLSPKLIYFIWIAAPVAIYLTYPIIGSPYFIWSYNWRNDGQGYDPYANRFYTRCTFLNFSLEEYTIHNPANGKCDWFIFRKSRSAKYVTSETGGRNSG